MPTRFRGSAPLTATRLPPHRSQQSDRLRQRVLLARESADKAAPADLASRLEAPVYAQHVAPRREQTLPLHEATKYDAVAAQQLPRDRFGDLLVGERRPVPHPRPPPRRLDAKCRHAAATPIAACLTQRLPPGRRHEQ